MKWSEFKEQLKKLFGDSPDKQKLIDEFKFTEDDIPKSEVKNKDGDIPPAMQAMLKEMKAENDRLLAELSERNKKDKEREELLQKKSEREFAEKIEAKLKKAVEDGKIPAKDEEKKKIYKAILEKDYENGEKIIDALPAIKKESDRDDSDTSRKSGSDANKPLDRGKLMNEVANSFKNEGK